MPTDFGKRSVNHCVLSKDIVSTSTIIPNLKDAFVTGMKMAVLSHVHELVSGSVEMYLFLLALSGSLPSNAR